MLIGFKGLFSLSIMVKFKNFALSKWCLYIYMKMNNLEEMIILINIINTDPSLLFYLSMIPCFNLKFAYTNSEFIKYFLLSKFECER